jgi:hypothetical protein
MHDTVSYYEIITQVTAFYFNRRSVTIAEIMQ